MRKVDRWQAFFTAAAVGNVEKIKTLVKKDEVCIQKIVRGRTALHVAVHNNQEGVVKALSETKELLSITDYSQRTPLHVAVSKGYVNIAEILIQNGAELHCWDREGNTPLLVAISQKNLELVILLVNHGASRKVYTNKIPLHMAIKNNLKPIVQILLNHGVNLLDICSCNSYPDPEFAEEIFNQRLKMLIAEECSDEEREGHKEAALHYAVSYGRGYQVRSLIESGANVNTKYHNGSSLLHMAIEKKYFSILEYLLTKMTDLNVVDDNGRTPLHLATKVPYWRPDFSQTDFEDSLKTMEILLKNGASVHVFDNTAKTPLHYAVEEEEFRPEKVRLLLDYKACVNAHLEKKFTPIFFAKCGAILQMLIDKGANVNHRGPISCFSTHLYDAIRNNDSTNIDILLENGAEIDSSSFHFGEDSEITETIVNGMMDVTTVIKKLVKHPTKYRHLIPILAKKHFQGELNSQEFLSASGFFFSRFKKYRMELERMRNVNVLSLNLLDILTMPIQKLRSYATKKEVVKFFESETLQEEFPLYSGMIMRRHKKAEEERNLIDSSAEVLDKSIFRLHNKKHLPDLVVYTITDMLHMVDLKKLVGL